MEKINWLQKFTSRKFWAAVAAFVTALLVFFNVGTEDMERIVALIGAFGSLIAYTLAEGMVDKARVEGEVVFIPDDDEPPEQE
jgi:phosphate/sulfate permease